METNEYLGGDIQHIKLNQGNTKAVQDYLNYYAIVGDDDNGEMMTEILTKTMTEDIRKSY
jgi:hypothetical protein